MGADATQRASGGLKWELDGGCFAITGNGSGATQVLAIAGDVEAISKRMGAVLQSEGPGREQKLPPRQSR